MRLYALLLCGTMATSDILSFFGSLCQMSKHLMACTYRFLHFSTVSSWSWQVASDSLADTWGTCFNIRIIFSRVQYFP